MLCRRVAKLLVLFILYQLLAACKPPPTYDMAKAEVANTENKIQLKEAEDIPPPAPVITMSGAYVDTEKVSLIRPRPWLSQQLVVHGNKLPFVFYVDQILGSTGTRISYDKTVDKKIPLSMEYSGSIRGALDELATVSGYHYEINNRDDSVNWTSLFTKVFNIKFVPGSADYEIGQALSLEASSDGEKDVSSLSDSQKSTLKGTISIWKDIEDTVTKLLSSDGTISVAESTTTVTVKDHSENIAEIAKYINQINYELSKQVRIQVQILEVQLTDEFQYGINWNVVKNFISNSATSALSLVSPGATNVQLTSLTPTTFTFKSDAGEFQNTNSIITALQQQGDVSIVTQPSVTTLNNQVAQLSIQASQNFVSGSDVSQNDNGNTGGPKTSTVTTGLSMYLLPKVNKDKIYLQISTMLSNLVSLDSFNVFTGGSGADSSTSESPSSETDGGSATQVGLSLTEIKTLSDALAQNSIPSFVQLPKVDARLINQRAVIKNGATLILSGYKEFKNNAKNNKFLESERLGAQSSVRDNRELVFLITPVIIDEESEYFEENA